MLRIIIHWYEFAVRMTSGWIKIEELAAAAARTRAASSNFCLHINVTVGGACPVDSHVSHASDPAHLYVVYMFQVSVFNLCEYEWGGREDKFSFK